MFSVRETDKLSSRVAIQVYRLEEKHPLGDPGRLSWDPEQPVCCVWFLSHRGYSVPSFQDKQPKPGASKWEHQNLNPASSDSQSLWGRNPSLLGGRNRVREVSVSSKQTREADLAGVRREQRPW